MLNTKNLTGKLTVYEHAILQNGHKTTFVPSALRETRTVQKGLFAAGREVNAWLPCGHGLQDRVEETTRQPHPYTFPRPAAMAHKLPGGALSPGAALEIERLAHTPGTWLAETSPLARPPQLPASHSHYLGLRLRVPPQGSNRSGRSLTGRPHLRSPSDTAVPGSARNNEKASSQKD